MHEKFSVLTESERQQLYEAIPLITILVAGADGNIDAKETSWAAKVTNIRSYTYAEDLRDYYMSVGEGFEKRLQEMIEEMPDDVSERKKLITEKLERVNPLLKKLDEDLAIHLYKDFLSFARHVARASGGFLTFGSVSSEEKKLIKLPMIKRPVHY